MTKDNKGLSRRDFLKAAATSTAAVVGVPAVAAAAPRPLQDTVNMVWDTFRRPGSGWNEERIETFQEMNPNVQIEFRPLSGSSQQDNYGRMRILHAAGDLGDIHAWDPSHYQFEGAINNGIIQPIESFVEADGLDLSEWFDNFIELQRFEDELYGLPSWGWAGFDTIVINKLKFDEAGIELSDDPSARDYTVDDFAEWARIFRDEDAGEYGFFINHSEAGLVTLCRTFNSSFISEDGTTCMILDDENARNAMRWAYDLTVEERLLPVGEDMGATAPSAMNAGRLASNWGGSLNVRNYKRDLESGTAEAPGEHWQALLPVREDGRFPSQIRGGTWNVHADSAHPDVAYQFLKHIAGFEGSVGFNLVASNFAMTRPDVVERLVEEDEVHEWFLSSLENGIPAYAPPNSRGSEYTTAINQWTAILMDWRDPVDFDQGLADLHAEVQAVLDMPPA